MTRPPDSNALPNQQEWTRYIESLVNDEPDVNKKLQFALSAVANKLDIALAQVEALQYDLRKIYESTGTPEPAAPAPPPSVAPAPTKKTITISSDWSRTWGSSTYYTGGGEYTNAQYLYQGSNPENKIGLVHFNTAPIRGKKILSASLYLKNINSAWSATFVAGLGTHAYDSAPTGKPGRSNGFDVGWSRGEGKYHPLPSWVLSGLSNGAIKGFSVGGIGPSDANSAWFEGDGLGNEPKLKVTYQT